MEVFLTNNVPESKLFGGKRNGYDPPTELVEFDNEITKLIELMKQFWLSV